MFPSMLSIEDILQTTKAARFSLIPTQVKMNSTDVKLLSNFKVTGVPLLVKN
jgi:hypothetical protein